MRMRKGIISLSFVAMLTLCVLNVAAAPVSKLTIVPRSDLITYAMAQEPTNLTITAPTQVKVNETFAITGYLTSGNNGISNAQVHLWWLLSANETYIMGNSTTDSDGSFAIKLYFITPGSFDIQYTYDGNNQYAPCASNVAEITVS
jgi:hypothetical protein